MFVVPNFYKKVSFVNHYGILRGGIANKSQIFNIKILPYLFVTNKVKNLFFRISLYGNFMP